MRYLLMESIPGTTLLVSCHPNAVLIYKLQILASSFSTTQLPIDQSLKLALLPEALQTDLLLQCSEEILFSDGIDGKEGVSRDPRSWSFY